MVMALGSLGLAPCSQSLVRQCHSRNGQPYVGNRAAPCESSLTPDIIVSAIRTNAGPTMQVVAYA
jgi:hypothetical protein